MIFSRWIRWIPLKWWIFHGYVSLPEVLVFRLAWWKAFPSLQPLGYWLRCVFFWGFGPNVMRAFCWFWGSVIFPVFSKTFQQKTRKISEVFDFLGRNPNPIIFKKNHRTPFFFQVQKKNQHCGMGFSSPEKICLWKVGWGEYVSDVPTLRTRD